MDFSLFFEKDDAVNYRILVVFSECQNTLVSETDLMEQFGLSTYKLRQAIELINVDLFEIGHEPASMIDNSEKGILKGVNITNEVLQLILLKYLHKSTIFSAFEYEFIYSNYMSKNIYIKKNFISKTTFYNASNQLQDILNQAKFFESSEEKGDDEYLVSLHLFQFYYTAYNGLESPFPELDSIIEQIINQIKDGFNLSITPTKQVKLEALIKVWLLRMKNDSFLQAMENSQFNIDDVHVQKLFPIVDIVKSELKIIISQLELNYLLVFLVTQEYVDRSEFEMASFTTNLASSLTDLFMQQIKQSKMFVANVPVDFEKIEQVINDIHIQFSTFFIEPTTFTSLDQLDFFHQTYPMFHELISDFINLVRKNNLSDFSNEEAANLYFSYMFALINTIPSAALNDKVFVCVDFSQGTLYSDYVINTLDSFRNAHIVIETVPSENTDIYLSDFRSHRLTDPTQIIWRNPPSPHDWSRLGETIVEYTQLKTDNIKISQ